MTLKWLVQASEFIQDYIVVCEMAVLSQAVLVCKHRSAIKCSLKKVQKRVSSSKLSNLKFVFTQLNLRIKDMLGQRVLSFIDRFPLFGG